MNENKINVAKNDSRVKISSNLKKIKIFSAMPKNNLKGIIIYCHGLGSNKTWAIRFYDKLLANNFGVYAFDFPGHGEDKTDFFLFTLNRCINYLNEVISYVTTKYEVPIFLFGCSFGGYVILNRLLENKLDIQKTILMCPAINFCEIMENKTGISDNYFNTNEYMPLYNNIKIYKNSYDEFKKKDKKIKSSTFENIAIIQGALDKTVAYEDIKKFCKKNNLELYTIEKGKHELYGYDEEIVNFIISVISRKMK